MFGITKDVLSIDYVKKFFYILPNIPRQVNIEITNKCNLDCKICKRKELKLPEVNLTFEMAKKIIDRLPEEIKEISLGGYGEPFINPEIYKIISYAKNKRKKVSITNNGWFMIKPENRRKALENGVDILRFSVEDVNDVGSEGHLYSKHILDALKELAQERNLGAYKTKLYFNTIVHKGNAEQISSIIAYAEKIGFDHIELIHMDKKSNSITNYLSTEEEIALYKKIRQMPWKIKVTSLLDRYDGIRKYGFRKMTKCPLTYDTAHITLDGDVTPCHFGLPRYKIDNILQKDLKEIWNGTAFKDFRKDQLKVCQGCTLMNFN